jgi:benzoyl-CoA-dihydrodiol lyase
VSLPEVPLLGVLPGTGGLTRVTDKRHVRHDTPTSSAPPPRACAGKRARLAAGRRDRQAGAVRAGVRERAVRCRAAATARRTPRRALEPHRAHATATRCATAREVQIDRAERTATLTCAAAGEQPRRLAGIDAAGAAGSPLAMARELDDAILHMRTNELDIGTWLLQDRGRAARCSPPTRRCSRTASTGSCARRSACCGARWRGSTCRRARCSRSSSRARALRARCSRSRWPPTAPTCWRWPDEPERAPQLVLGETNLGYFPMVNGQSRLERRFYEETEPMERVRAAVGQPLAADSALELGLVTSAPDDIDWTDELRIAIEERMAMSPDALTGLEANLRFASKETMETRIFGRLTAWQNWIFIRPNAVGDKGALKVYGKGEKAAFDWNRV